MAKIDITKQTADELYHIIDHYYDNPIFTLTDDMIKLYFDLKNIANIK